MPKLKLSSNVSELGLMRPFAQTRGRLVASTVIATALAIGFGLGSASYVVNTSDSVVLNLGVITLNMMMTIIAAFLIAIVVGDFFFPGPWRQQVILGNTPSEGITVKDHNAEFLVIFLLALAGCTATINYGAGNFFDFYHNEAFFSVRLRSEDPNERLAAFEDLRDPMNLEIWERPGIQAMVKKHIEDPDSNVRRAAIWNAAMIKIDSTRPSIEAILADTTVDSEVRAEAATALGKLGLSESSRLALEAALKTKDKTTQIGALRGLALMKSPLSADAVRPLASSEDEDLRIHALWVLRRVQDEKAKPLILEQLAKDDVSDRDRCALMDALKMVATTDDVMWARKLYKRTAKDTVCEPVVWEERDETQHYVVYSDSHRVKLLKIVANADAKTHIEWIRRLVMDSEEESYVREVGNEVLRRVEGQGF